MLNGLFGFRCRQTEAKITPLPPTQVLAVTKYALQQGYDWCMKLDDDLFVNPVTLARNIVQWNERGIEWLGYVHNVVKDSDNGEPVEVINRDWHFGKASRSFVNNSEYAGVTPVAVNGGLGYFLHKHALEKLHAVAQESQAWLNESQWVNIYEDLLMAYLLLSGGVTLTDWSGWQLRYTGAAPGRKPSYPLSIDEVLMRPHGKEALNALLECRDSRKMTWKDFSPRCDIVSEGTPYEIRDEIENCAAVIGLCKMPRACGEVEGSLDAVMKKLQSQLIANATSTQAVNRPQPMADDSTQAQPACKLWELGSESSETHSDSQHRNSDIIFDTIFEKS